LKRAIVFGSQPHMIAKLVAPFGEDGKNATARVIELFYPERKRPEG
jgi:hypothetical protein